MKRYFLIGFVFLFALAFLGQVSATDLMPNCKYSSQTVLTCTVNAVQGATSFELNVDNLKVTLKEIQLDFNSGETVRVVQTKLKDINFAVNEINLSTLSAIPKLYFDIKEITPSHTFYISNFSGGPILEINFVDKSPKSVSAFFVINSNVAIKSFNPTTVDLLKISDSKFNYSNVIFVDFNVINKIGTIKIEGQSLVNDGNITSQTKLVINPPNALDTFLQVDKITLIGGSIISYYPLELKKNSSVSKFGSITTPALKLADANIIFNDNSIFYSPYILAYGNNSTVFVNGLTNRNVGVVASFLESTGVKKSVVDFNGIVNHNPMDFVFIPKSKDGDEYYIILQNSESLDMNIKFEDQTSQKSNPEDFYKLLQVNSSKDVIVYGPKFDKIDSLPAGKGQLFYVVDSNDVTMEGFQYYHKDATKKEMFNGSPIILQNVDGFVLKNSVINNAYTAIVMNATNFVPAKQTLFYSNSFSYNNLVLKADANNVVKVFNNFFIDNKGIASVHPLSTAFFDLEPVLQGVSKGSNAKCDKQPNPQDDPSLPLPSIPMYYFEDLEFVTKSYSPVCFAGNLFAGASAIQGYKDAYLVDGLDDDNVSDFKYEFFPTKIDYAPLVYDEYKKDFNIPLGSSEFNDYLYPFLEIYEKLPDKDCGSTITSTVQPLQVLTLFKYVPYTYPWTLKVSKFGTNGWEFCTPNFDFNVIVQNPIFEFNINGTKTIISTEHKEVDKNGIWSSELAIATNDTNIVLNNLEGIDYNVFLEFGLGSSKGITNKQKKQIKDWIGYNINFKQLGLEPPYQIGPFYIYNDKNTIQYIIDPLKLNLSCDIVLDITGVNDQYDFNDGFLDVNIVVKNNNLYNLQIPFSVNLVDSSNVVMYSSQYSLDISAGSSNSMVYSKDISKLLVGKYSLQVSTNACGKIIVNNPFEIVQSLKLKTIKTPDNNIYFVFVLAVLVIGFYLFRKS